MTSTNPVDANRSSNEKRPILMALGAIVMMAGVAGSYILTKVLLHLFNDQSGAFTTLVWYQIIWLIFFLGVIVAGISIFLAAIRGRQHNLIPGPTLYIMGLALLVNGFFLMVYGNWPMAILGILAGAVFILLEYKTDIA